MPFKLNSPLQGAGAARQVNFPLPQFNNVITLARPLPFLPSALPGTTVPACTLMVADLGVVQDPTRTFSPCQPNGVPGNSVQSMVLGR